MAQHSRSPQFWLPASSLTSWLSGRRMCGRCTIVTTRWQRSRSPTASSRGCRDGSMPNPGSRSTRPLFDAELAATESEDWHEADRLYHGIREELRLTYPEGGDVPEFLLHVRGDEAWFR